MFGWTVSTMSLAMAKAGMSQARSTMVKALIAGSAMMARFRMSALADVASPRPKTANGRMIATHRRGMMPTVMNQLHSKQLKLPRLMDSQLILADRLRVMNAPYGMAANSYG